jgi:hypothetical protein
MVACWLLLLPAAAASELDSVISAGNRAAGVTEHPLPVIDDAAFLRRIYIDLIGRIPTADEVLDFAQQPSAGRRAHLIDQLLQEPRFADRWTLFYADMLRLRSQVTGGAALIAYVHNAIKTGMPYDEMCRKLISTNGKAGKTPEVGFVLGDNADPLAMASVTSQVFLGVRIGCAQCHDHPFDTWTRRDFYDMAAFYGKTRRFESELTRVVYAVEGDQSSVLWPPEGVGPEGDRRPIAPRFPFGLVAYDSKPDFVARLQETRERKAAALLAAKGKDVSLEDLLSRSSEKAVKATVGGLDADVAEAEVKGDIRKIDVEADIYRQSERRKELAEFVTHPGNRYFSRAIVNRVWKTLIGRGFVEPVDDFRADNPPAHPQALDYLADEFVASDYDLRTLVRLIVTSDCYQRGHAPFDAPEATRQNVETNLLATPVRRMIAESLYDSILTAGRLYEPKHSPGRNEKVVLETVRVAKAKDVTAAVAGSVEASLAGSPRVVASTAAMTGMTGMTAMSGMAAMAGQDDGESGYALETAIELDFNALLSADDGEEVALDRMKAMSKEELETQRMTQMAMSGEAGVEFEYKTVSKTIDDNPVFNSSLRMQSPAPNGHFLRVFGQPNRQELGDLRDDSASMRQALMMLNGRITHEATRVGDLEPMYGLLAGNASDLDAAITLAYTEILTRPPSAAEIAEGKVLLGAAPNPLEGMADLRWVLMNCNEFRFLP